MMTAINVITMQHFATCDMLFFASFSILSIFLHICIVPFKVHFNIILFITTLTKNPIAYCCIESNLQGKVVEKSKTYSGS